MYCMRHINKNSCKHNNKISINPNLIKKSQIKPLTVILDLDNTLIASFIMKPNSGICDFLFTLQNEGQMAKIGVVKRPNVDSFLSALSKIATIYLFTSATKEYVSEILSQIDPFGTYFSKIFTREHCIKDEEKLRKDYSICGTNMSRTLIVDDIPENFRNFSSNGIPIKPYKGGYNDNSLCQVLQQIIYLSRLTDVRNGIAA